MPSALFAPASFQAIRPKVEFAKTSEEDVTEIRKARLAVAEMAAGSSLLFFLL